ncbi:MAG: radical SAM protein [Dehalococcoidia bacterium]|nr:MAG: radical SAM protein [Dehalococcoidia bacterium]
MQGQEDSRRFERPGIFRPPSERKSYFLPLTSGCSNNTCTFCGLYGCRLRIRDVGEVKAEIDALALYWRNGVRLAGVESIVYAIAHGWDGRRVFLQDGDALVYPYPKLVEALQYLNEKLPGLERVSTYATPQDILRRTVDELRELKKLKMGILYTGIESGADEVLQRVGKAVSSDQLIEAGRKAKEAGIELSLTIILGLGGVDGSREHMIETARVLSAIDPEYVGALTLTLVPGTPLYREWEQGRFKLMSPFEFLEELKGIIENSSFSDCFFSSMHASNYLSVRGVLSEDKDKMIQEIENVLSNRDPKSLRPEFLRGL